MHINFHYFSSLLPLSICWSVHEQPNERQNVHVRHRHIQKMRHRIHPRRSLLVQRESNEKTRVVRSATHSSSIFFSFALSFRSGQLVATCSCFFAVVHCFWNRFLPLLRYDQSFVLLFYERIVHTHPICERTCTHRRLVGLPLPRHNLRHRRRHNFPWTDFYDNLFLCTQTFPSSISLCSQRRYTAEDAVDEIHGKTNTKKKTWIWELVRIHCVWTAVSMHTSPTTYTPVVHRAL